MWIPLHQSLPRHPRTLRLARRLGVSTAQAVGHLTMLWLWAVDYAEDGDLSPFDAEDLAAAADWSDDPEAFVAALQATGWIEPDGSLHAWTQHAGKRLADLAADAQRKRAERQERVVQRVSTGRPSDVPRRSGVEKRREDKRRTEDPPPTPPAAAEGERGSDLVEVERPRPAAAAPPARPRPRSHPPAPPAQPAIACPHLASEAFRESLASYEAEQRPAMTANRRRKLLERLAAMPLEQAIAALEQSVAFGWKAVAVQPRTGGGPSGPQRETPLEWATRVAERIEAKERERALAGGAS